MFNSSAPLDTISRGIMRIGNFEMSLLVMLANADNNTGKRKSATVEGVYASKKYNDIAQTKSIYFNPQSLLKLSIITFEEGKRSDKFLTCGPRHMYGLRSCFNVVANWFETIDDMFYEVDGELRLNNKYSSYYSFTKVASNKELRIKPIVHRTDDGDMDGVVLIFNDYSDTITLSVEDFFIINDQIQRMDLFSSSQLLINYAALCYNPTIDSLYRN